MRWSPICLNAFMFTRIIRDTASSTEEGPLLVGWKVVMIIGAHGWGGPLAISTDWLRRAWKNTQDIWRATAARRHVAFARVFKPWQIKNAKEFKAFKHKEKLNWVLARAVFGAHAESRVSLTARPNRVLLRHLLHLKRTNTNHSFKHANRKRVQFSTCARWDGDLCARSETRLFYKMMSKYPSWRVSSKKLSVMS